MQLIDDNNYKKVAFIEKKNSDSILNLNTIYNFQGSIWIVSFQDFIII